MAYSLVFRHERWVLELQKWEEHFYWSHFEESNFRFLKVMDRGFSEKMEFPVKFSKNFRVDLIPVVSLEMPTGQSWVIGLQKEQEHFYFTGGWKQFIEANKIKKDQTLIFQYNGDSSFLVQIFDQAGCVRVAYDLAIDSRAKQKKADLTLEKFQISNSSEVRDDSPMLHGAYDSRSTSTTRACGAGEIYSGRRVGCSRICNQEHNDLDSDSRSETNSEDPVKTIPTKFLSECIPRKPYGITICNPSNKELFVHCKWMNTAWGFYGKSLLKLIQENKLKEGDACVFKLKERKKLVLEMSIVVAEEVDYILKNSWS
ncbi:hypothetical protein KSP40_PGU003777 [Platanthera guangdongensis]|uniref:TF-B3 domain-containing protein n=1 Tax=Platanthera guangdongensis TaxID=2320717 RepID=A0ABR2MXI2_9ASPA